MQTRIQLTDTLVEMIVKMTEGNPGATKAIGSMIHITSVIDPDCAFGLRGPIIYLDSYGIYGSAIYTLYNDHCNRNPHKMLVLLRAAQMGIFNSNKLYQLSQDQTRENSISTEEWDRIVGELKEKLPSMNVDL